MSGMTNEEIMSEFESLFASEQPDEEAPEEEEKEETPDETSEEEPQNDEEEKSEEESEQAKDESKDESDSHKKTPPDTQSKANHAFAEQRLQIKKQNDFIRNIGKLIGFDKDASLEEIQEKVAEALLEKQSKEQNVPVELLKRIEQAESLLQENDRIKLEKKVTEDFTDLIDAYNLSEDEVKEFTSYLIDEGKNPLVEKNVDLKAEYLKLHYDDLVKRAVDEALAKEQKRQKKVDEQASSGAPHGQSDKEAPMINTVKDLDDFFAHTDL